MPIPRELLVEESKGNIYCEYVNFWCEIIVENYWIFLADSLLARYCGVQEFK